MSLDPIVIETLVTGTITTKGNKMAEKDSKQAELDQTLNERNSDVEREEPSDRSIPKRLARIFIPC